MLLSVLAGQLEVVGERSRRLALEVHVGVVEVALEAAEARSELGLLAFVAACGLCERPGRRPSGRREPLVEHRDGGFGGGLINRVDRRREHTERRRQRRGGGHDEPARHHGGRYLGVAGSRTEYSWP